MKKTTILGQAALAAAITFVAPHVHAADKLKVGMMLPATGTYAKIGAVIQNGFKLYVSENGGKLGGREIEYIDVDSEANPAKAIDNVNKLIKQYDVDVIIGSVHSGVAMAMAKEANAAGKLLIVPNAGADQVTGPFCSENIYRSSFSNWQPAYAAGQAMAAKGIKTAVTMTWKYGAGEQMVAGFKEAFEKGGGKIVEEMYVPFPNVEFQAQLTQIASIKPQAVFSFFAGGGAIKFVNDYAAAGLKASIPLYGTGFLTDGTLEAQGESAVGVMTALHYADNLDIAKDKSFRMAYSKAYNGESPDVYAVQGYDAAQILGIGLAATGGDVSKKAEFAAAVEAATIDSPRGKFTMSKAHNPVQNFYLREVKDGKNMPVSIASAALADPARGCKM